MDWQFGDQNALHAAVTQGAHAMTQLENYAVAIGDKLRTVRFLFKKIYFYN